MAGENILTTTLSRMKGYLLIAIVAVSILFLCGVFYAGYRYKKCPEPAPVDTSVEDSLSRAAARWEGMAKAFRVERDEARRLRDIYKKSIRPTSEVIKKNTDAIRSNGFNAAVDTNDRRPE